MTDKKQNHDIDPPHDGDAAASEESHAPLATAPVELEPSRVVYHRTEPAAANIPMSESVARARSIWTRELSPAIIPLIIGFLSLLILIGLIGYKSINRMDEVGHDVLDLEQQHLARLSLLLNLRLAVTKLNNEARLRAQADARRELQPPFEIRLNTARSDLKPLLRDLERPAAGDPVLSKFRDDLIAYVKTTEDLRNYSLEGFGKFDVVDKEVNRLLEESNSRQIEVSQKSDVIAQAASQSIRTWSVIALIFGALVAAGTIWEIQRRFGQMRRSVEESRRERNFTSQLLEGMVSAVAAIDEDDRIRSANAAFFRIFPRA
ncbi:MAG TPA: hypothetical protein VE977_11620, partial [Pyrinomonadaceae bacterium]|nr:hypothetical protein [Pyrinomonadaceae bacterium]